MDEHAEQHGCCDHSTGHAEHEHGHHTSRLVELIRIALVAAAVLASWLCALATGGTAGGHLAGRDRGRRRADLEGGARRAARAAHDDGAFDDRRLGGARHRRDLHRVVIVLFVLVAEISSTTVGRGRRAIRELSAPPRTATVREAAAPSSPRWLLPAGACHRQAGGAPPGRREVVAAQLRRPGHRHRGVAAGREGPGAQVYAGTDQPVGRARGARRGVARHHLRPDRRGRRAAERPRANPEDRGSPRRLPGLLRARRCAASPSRSRGTRARRSRSSSSPAPAASPPVRRSRSSAPSGARPAGAIVKGGLYLETLGTSIPWCSTRPARSPRHARGRERTPAAGRRGDVLAAAAVAESAVRASAGKAILARLADTPPEPTLRLHAGARASSAAWTGSEIIAGNRALLAGRGVSLDARAGPEAPLGGARGAWRRAARRDSHRRRLRPEALAAVARCRRWECARSCSRGTAAASRRRWRSGSAVDEIGGGLLPEEKLERVRR